jgi:hypothetical protein
MTLPEVEEIVEQDAEMRQMLADMTRRQASGRRQQRRAVQQARHRPPSIYS